MRHMPLTFPPAFIDLFFSSSMHLMLTSALSTKAMISLSIHGVTNEEECKKWHRRQMTNQLPPPTEQDDTTEPAEHKPLVQIIKHLQEVVFKISLPKTEAVKLVKIPIDTLHLRHNLTVAACSSMQESLPKMGESSRPDHIEWQLKGIKACLATSALLPLPPPPQKHTYAAAVLAMNTCPPSPSPIAFTPRRLPFT